MIWSIQIEKLNPIKGKQGIVDLKFNFLVENKLFKRDEKNQGLTAGVTSTKLNEGKTTLQRISGELLFHFAEYELKIYF